MSVNTRQDMSFGSFIRAPPNLRRYAPPHQLYLDIPTQAPIQAPAQYSHSARSVYRLPLQPLAANTLPRGQQHLQPIKMADQDFKMDFMFDEYFNETNILNISKASLQLPMCAQAMPQTYSFRPWYSDDHDTSTTLPQGTPVPMKIDNAPDVPTPAVISTSVDVSKYENVEHRVWLEGLPDYTGISPASVETFASSPRSEDIENFDNHAATHNFNSWAYMHPHGMPAGRLHSIAPSITDESSASPALSYDELNHSSSVISQSTSMFGQPDVVPPSGFRRPNHHDQTVMATPHDVERPQSQQSGRAFSMLPTMQLRHGPEDEAYVQRRDKMLIDLRGKGHSYKDIKRLGKFKEAESTLRGRLRTLTKEKSERVRKPKWTNRDIELLNDAVEHFLTEGPRTSRKRKQHRKLPWKKISQWMKDNGSSYLFAPATCAKKWEDI